MIAILFACAGEVDPIDSAVSVDTGTPVPDPTPWDPPEDAEAPDHTLAQLQAGFDVGIAALAAVDGEALFQGYADATMRGTPSCPAAYPAVGVTTGWGNDCTTPDGWHFYGRGQAAWFPETVIEGVPYAPYGEFINTSTITHPDGAALVMDGRGTFVGWREGEADRLAATLLGTFAYTGDGDEGWIAPGWLDRAPSVGLELSLGEAGEAREATLEGGLAYDDGLADGAVGVRAEHFVATLDAGACDAAGELVLLGDAGQRYRLALTTGGGCTPCLDATRDGRILGEVCVDVSPFVTWTERPW